MDKLITGDKISKVLFELGDDTFLKIESATLFALKTTDSLSALPNREGGI
jgi:hypothetical protein